MKMQAPLIVAAFILFALSGCSAPPSNSSSAASDEGTESASASEAGTSTTVTASSSAQDNVEPTADELFFNENVPFASERGRKLVPLHWDIDNAYIVGYQGAGPVWGSCGECCIANTLNMVTGSSYTEEDIVRFVADHGWYEPSTGGMTINDMANAYSALLPLKSMDVYGYGGDYAPTIEDMATRLENGIILNVSVYGEMMREGGHVGEGEINGTHWIVVQSVYRNADGSLAGFGIIDSASDITYLTAQELTDFYYGHDGTTIVDPSCIQVYGWEPSR